MDWKQTSMLMLVLSTAFSPINHMVFMQTRPTRSKQSTISMNSFIPFRLMLESHDGIGICSSLSRHLTREVLQGSILSPILFNIHIRRVGKSLRWLHCHQYEDDIQLYVSFSTLIIYAIIKISWCLEERSQWRKSSSLLICFCIYVCFQSLQD